VSDPGDGKRRAMVSVAQPGTLRRAHRQPRVYPDVQEPLFAEVRSFPMTSYRDTTPRWFSQNPDRAWAEIFFLIYIPIWIAIVVVVNASYRNFGNTGDIV
jgi:hypothetical protein